MDISWYREQLKNVPKYKGVTWTLRVDRMKNSQVLAIYNKFKEQGLFDRRRKAFKENSTCIQMTLFDYPEFGYSEKTKEDYL